MDGDRTGHFAWYARYIHVSQKIGVFIWIVLWVNKADGLQLPVSFVRENV